MDAALAKDRERGIHHQPHVAEGEFLAHDAAPPGGPEVNHRRSPGGYHNRLKAGTLVLALLPASASATVVTVTSVLPPELALWRRLAGVPGQPRGGQP
jgi:hypothetical protein